MNGWCTYRCLNDSDTVRHEVYTCTYIFITMNVSTSCHMTDNTCSAGLWTEFATKKIASEYDIVM